MKRIAVGIFVIVLFTVGCMSAGAEYFICLGSFTVPENAADYRAELSAVGYRTFTDSAFVNGRLFTRVLYRYPFKSYDNAQATLRALSQSRVVLRNRIYDLWILSDTFAVSQTSSPSFSPRASEGKGLALTPEGRDIGEDHDNKDFEGPIESTGPRVDEQAIAGPAMDETSPDEPTAHEPEIASADEPGMDETAAEGPATVGPSAPKPDTTDSSGAQATSAAASSVTKTESEATESGGAVDDAVDGAEEEGWKSVPGNPYKKIHEEGYANCIFAGNPIGLGEEDQHQLKKTFTAPGDVYARCYLPGPIGPIDGENFWHELWVDGKLRRRTFFNEPPEPAWDQIQIWITEDEYSRQMNELSSGEHEIIIWVMKNEYRGERAVAGENAAGEITAEMKEIWVPVRLSKSKFTYIVP